VAYCCAAFCRGGLSSGILYVAFCRGGLSCGILYVAFCRVAFCSTLVLIGKYQGLFIMVFGSIIYRKSRRCVVQCALTFDQLDRDTSLRLLILLLPIVTVVLADLEIES